MTDYENAETNLGEIQDPPWLEYHEGPICLHSGDSSHWLVRGDLLFANERLREEILSCWQAYLDRVYYNHRFHFIAVPQGGIPWARALADRFHEAVWDCGGDGPYLDDKRYLHIAVDDVLTTGSSLAGMPDKISGALVAVDRRMHLEDYTPLYYRLRSGQIRPIFSWARINLSRRMPEE